MSKHTTYLDFGALGEQKITISYDLQPYEVETRDYPGCDASATINTLRWNNINITEYINEDIIEALEEEILEALADSREWED